MDLTKDTPYTIRYRTRDLGHIDAPEEGTMHAVWTGEIDTWGKYTFRPTDGGTPRRLLRDEFTVLEDDAEYPSDAARDDDYDRRLYDAAPDMRALLQRIADTPCDPGPAPFCPRDEARALLARINGKVG
jgi:hypothetical protein